MLEPAIRPDPPGDIAQQDRCDNDYERMHTSIPIKDMRAESERRVPDRLGHLARQIHQPILRPFMRIGLVCSLLLALVGTGCVQRTLTVKSDPPGAIVSLNGVEVGRTPIQRDFIWYGVYDVELRKEGYEPLKKRGDVIAPWWQWVPLDFFTEFVPLHDKHTLMYRMEPLKEVSADPKVMLHNAAELRPMLQSSKNTRIPDPHPATQATDFSF
jgi:hypothetical protein